MGLDESIVERNSLYPGEWPYHNRCPPAGIYVQDFGKGIDPRYHQSIFDRYFRVPGTKVQGSGLGLAISKDFVETHGGTLSVDSVVGKGSAFVINQCVRV